jgi:hypothetical protein
MHALLKYPNILVVFKEKSVPNGLQERSKYLLMLSVEILDILSEQRLLLAWLL